MRFHRERSDGFPSRTEHLTLCSADVLAKKGNILFYDEKKRIVCIVIMFFIAFRLHPELAKKKQTVFSIIFISKILIQMIQNNSW